MTAAKAGDYGLRRKFRELQTVCFSVHTKVLAGLVDMVRMAKLGINFKEQLRKTLSAVAEY